MADKQIVLASDRKTGFVRRLIVGAGCLALLGGLQVSQVPFLTDLDILGSGAAYAQKEKREKPKTKRADTVSKKVGEQLIKAQEAQLEDRFAEAMSILQRLSKQKLSPYESAVVWRQMGYIYTQQENYKSALVAFERAFGFKALDETQQLDLQFFLGQLYLAEDRVDDAIRTLEAWMRASGDDAAPTAFFVLAQAYSIKENYPRALSYAERGMTKARASGTIRESWYRVTTNLYLQTQKYKSAKTLLIEMVRMFPGKKAYWNQLGATYQQLEDDKNAYYIRLMMYQQGMLAKSRELELMANLNLYHEVPYRSVKVLKKGFADGIVDKKAKNYELFASAFQESREWKDAIKPLTQAAKLSDDGDLYVRLCQSYLYDLKYAKAESACVSAINKGSLKDTGAAWMLLGTARYNRDRKTTALAAFRKASKFDKTRKNANQWIKFLEQEAENDRIRAAQAKAREDKAAADAAAAAAQAELDN